MCNDVIFTGHLDLPEIPLMALQKSAGNQAVARLMRLNSALDV